MKTSTILACVFLAFGFVLQTYVAVFESSQFSLGFWLWGLSPYLIGTVLLLFLRQPHATVGALLVPVVLDIGNFYSVFIAPRSSTAALGLLFVPLWSLLVFVPLGGFIGWWVGKRLRGTALSNKTIEPTR